MELDSLPKIELTFAETCLSAKRGIYFWLNQKTDEVVYIGVALGVGGLRKRIVGQHLNPAYLEFRRSKHTVKDTFQLAHAVERISRDGLTVRHGIDKSAFRKSIGRKLEIRPGVDTVSFIKQNLYLKVHESEDIAMVKKLEVDLIIKLLPLFNTSHKPA